MTLDHEAIREAYPDAVTIYDDKGAFKADGSKIELVQSNIDTARIKLNQAAEQVKYKTNRLNEYPSFEDQFDLIYHSGIDAWKAKIKETKDNYPTPS